jgi:D-alanyl-D-alanine carboxypeptidase
MTATDPRRLDPTSATAPRRVDPASATGPRRVDPASAPGHRPLAATSTAAPPDPDRAARLDAVLERLVSRRGITHAVAGVATLDGSFRWHAAAGTARPDGTPMRPQTPFFLASVTKLYIATAVLQLVERGEVDLDAPFTAYLPAEVTAGLHRLDGVDHTPAITVRHLLSHTSGLPDFLEDRPKGGRSWYRELMDGRDRAWTFQDVVTRTRDELTPRFAPQDLGAPRQRARYSDTGFQLLIAIVEAVTGQGLQTVFEQRILRPLGLRQTYLPGRSRPLDPAPLPAVVYDRRRPLEIPRALVSCLDLVGTVDDTERFLRAFVRGELFADPGTVAVTQERWNRIGYPLRYGLGTMRFPINRLMGPGRRPATLIGHSGATGSWAFHCPELDVLLTGTVDQVRGRAVPFRAMARFLQAYHG